MELKEADRGLRNFVTMIIFLLCMFDTLFFVMTVILYNSIFTIFQISSIVNVHFCKDAIIIVLKIHSNSLLLGCKIFQSKNLDILFFAIQFKNCAVTVVIECTIVCMSVLMALH